MFSGHFVFVHLVNQSIHRQMRTYRLQGQQAFALCCQSLESDLSGRVKHFSVCLVFLNSNLSSHLLVPQPLLYLSSYIKPCWMMSSCLELWLLCRYLSSLQSSEMSKISHTNNEL